MIQRQVKLKLTKRQERQLDHWLRHLTAVWNWSISNLLNGHGAKIGMPQDAICGTLWTAFTAWQRCFKRVSRKPRFRGRRNRLNSIAFAHGTRMRDSKIYVEEKGVG